MSAYMQSHRHIDYLVDAAYRLDVTWHDWQGKDPHSMTYQEVSTRYRRVWDYTREDMGSILVTEQLASVSHRYPQDTLDDLPGYLPDTGREYRHRSGSAYLDTHPLNVLQACAGYEYQSCEHPGWRTSEARQIIEAIRDRAIRAAVDAAGVPSCYWSLDDTHLPTIAGGTRA